MYVCFNIKNIYFFFFIGKIKLPLSQYWQTWCSSHHKLFPCLFLSIKLLSVDIPAKFCRLQKYIFMYKLLLYWLRGIVVAAFKILTLITRHRRQLFYLFFCALMHIAAVFHLMWIAPICSVVVASRFQHIENYFPSMWVVVLYGSNFLTKTCVCTFCKAYKNLTWNRNLLRAVAVCLECVSWQVSCWKRRFYLVEIIFEFLLITCM